MSESLLAIVVVFAEIGLFLLLGLVIWLVMYFLRSKKETALTKMFINKVKFNVSAHRDSLNVIFQNDFDLEEKKAEINASALADDEIVLVKNLVYGLSGNKEAMFLKVPGDLDKLLKHYIKLLTQGELTTLEGSSDNASKLLLLKKENEALRLENIAITTQLNDATTTIENMLGEYASMYDGGRKEGEQRVKNEMYQLKQKLSTSKVEAGDLESENIEDKES